MGALHPILFFAVMYVVVLFFSIFICSSLFYSCKSSTEAAMAKKTTAACTKQVRIACPGFNSCCVPLSIGCANNFMQAYCADCVR